VEGARYFGHRRSVHDAGAIPGQAKFRRAEGTEQPVRLWGDAVSTVPLVLMDRVVAFAFAQSKYTCIWLDVMRMLHIELNSSLNTMYILSNLFHSG
jgi:hypothetical protein